MSVFVLIHGAFHGRWCFRRLVPALESQGHEVITLDLPGHGECPRDPRSVTMDDYVEAVSGAIDGVGDQAPILVGHSMAGMVITAVAEKLPTRIAGLSYIAGYLPKSGESLLAIEGRNPEPRMVAVVTPTQDMTMAHIDPIRAADLFYNDCSDRDRELSSSRLCPQPGAPFLTPVTTSETAFGTVPKHYFLCEKDLCISPALQEDMLAARQDVAVERLDAGHSPFLSRVDDVAAGLMRFAEGLVAPTGSVAA